MEQIYAQHQLLKQDNVEAAAFFEGCSQAELDGLAAGNISVQLYETRFARVASVYSFIREPTFIAVCADLFQDGRYHTTGADTLMTVSAQGSGGENATVGIPMHTDGMYFNDSRYSVTVWIPLDPCGRDAPGLEVVIADHHDVRRYAGFEASRAAPPDRKWNWHHYRDGAFDDAELRRHYGPDRWRAPEFDIGDLMVFSNWAIHGSYRTPAMTKRRSAIQLRLESDSFDPSSPA